MAGISHFILLQLLYVRLLHIRKAAGCESDRNVICVKMILDKFLSNFTDSIFFLQIGCLRIMCEIQMETENSIIAQRIDLHTYEYFYI